VNWFDIITAILIAGLLVWLILNAVEGHKLREKIERLNDRVTDRYSQAATWDTSRQQELLTLSNRVYKLEAKPKLPDVVSLSTRVGNKLVVTFNDEWTSHFVHVFIGNVRWKTVLVEVHNQVEIPIPAASWSKEISVIVTPNDLAIATPVEAQATVE
jgi:hypothetical protein